MVKQVIAVDEAILIYGALGPLHLILALSIGISRIYLGAQYPLDVAAGAALGSIAGAAVRLLMPGAPWF